MKSIFEVRNITISDNPTKFYQDLLCFLGKYEIEANIEDYSDLSEFQNYLSKINLEELIEFNKVIYYVNHTISLSDAKKQRLTDKLNSVCEMLLFNDIKFLYFKSLIDRNDKKQLKRVIATYKKDYKRILLLQELFYKIENFIDNKKLHSYLNEQICNLTPVDYINLIYNELTKESISLSIIKELNDKLKIDDNFNKISNIDMVKIIINMLENDFDITNKLDSFDDYEETKLDLLKKLNKILLVLGVKGTNSKIKNALKNKNIILSNDFPLECKKFNYTYTYMEDYTVEKDKKIITIDFSPFAKSLDGAFSISKRDNLWFLDVYISDVPAYLNYNRELAHLAYERGSNYYIRDNNNQIKFVYNMLPKALSQNYLSLNNNSRKNVIDFSFIIDDKGNILSKNISKKSIVINYPLTLSYVKSIFNGNSYSKVYYKLQELNDLYDILSNNSSLKYFSNLSKSKNRDLVQILSILVNYYIAEEAYLAIYRNRNEGKFTQEKTDYAISSTPLRKIVSDINLGLFLNQKGLLAITDRDIYRVEDNMRQIVKHVNYIEEVEKYIETHQNEVYQYIKK